MAYARVRQNINPAFILSRLKLRLFVGNVCVFIKWEII